MNKDFYYRLFVFTFTILLCFMANAETTLEDIIDTTYDEELFDSIKNNIKIPEDYDLSRALKGMQYMVEVEGFSISGAAGLIGNGYAESRLMVGRYNGYYIGLFQWDPKHRWPKIKEYLEENKVDIENQELLYLWELSAAFHSDDAADFEETINYCKECEDAEESAVHWCKHFEGTTSALKTRKKIAKLSVDVYKQYLELMDGCNS